MPEKEIKIGRTAIPEQDPKIRAGNFDEVALGYDADLAQREAGRCLQCKRPKCIDSCPVEVDIPAFVGLVAEGEYDEALSKIRDKNVLPAICGRVCPQEVQCEKDCVLGVKGEPVAIGRLERFVADLQIAKGTTIEPASVADNGIKVAVIGAGPAGLTVAGDLAKLGYQVKIFEALHQPGGVLVYGIPEFRLPKAVVGLEIDYVRALGVEIECNSVIGRLYELDDLRREGYKAFFIGTGAGLPMFMGLPGENLNGVYSANEFLTRVNLMKAYQFPDADTPVIRGHRVAVVGGGNVAMDSARTALRLGAQEVHLIYRRSRAEMPARLEEVHHAEEEGVIFDFLTNPLEIFGEEHWVTGLRCVRMELGEPDASGRSRPVPIAGSEFDTQIDEVIMAIGTSANPLLLDTIPDLARTPRGYVETVDDSGRTSIADIFAGGDIVTGSATVILAMGAGRKAAQAIHAYLSGEPEPPLIND